MLTIVAMSPAYRKAMSLKIQEFERAKLMPRPYRMPKARPIVPYQYDAESQRVEIVLTTG